MLNPLILWGAGGTAVVCIVVEATLVIHAVRRYRAQQRVWREEGQIS